MAGVCSPQLAVAVEARWLSPSSFRSPSWTSASCSLSHSSPILYLLLIQPPHKQHRTLRLTHTALSYCVNQLTWYVRCLLPYSHPHPVWLMGLEVFEAPVSWEVSSERYRVIAGGNFQLPHSTVDLLYSHTQQERTGRADCIST